MGKEKIIIVAHGSPKKEANFWLPLIKKLQIVLNKSEEDIKLCFLQFEKPDLWTALFEAVNEGAKTIIVHPFFLSAGVHVTKDIPEILKKFKKENSQVEVIYTNPLGLHEKLAEVIKDRIEETKKLLPVEIEEKSFQIIEKEIDLSNFSLPEKEIIKRVIHATADPEYKESMIFHKDAVSYALKALRGGKDILVDVEMVKAGISKKYLNNNKILCYLSEVPDINEGTRTEKAIELAFQREKNIGIVAIGNSPTALLKTIEILNSLNKKDIVVIGMSVGFVKALEAKILLAKQDFPFITNLSKKGGSSATVAVINALLRLKESING